MREMTDPRREGLPTAIPAEELQKMLGVNATFGSWDSENSTLSDSVTRWPFLFSRPLMGANRTTRILSKLCDAEK
jgi:hypothetical protein